MEEEIFQIIIDYRELKNKVTKELFRLGVRIIPKQLEVADFIPCEEIGVERKRIDDFLNSLIDGRLFNQIKNLKETFKKPLILVEGKENIYSLRNIHPNAIRGALASISLDYQIPIIFTEDEIDTAHFLYTIIKREQKDNKPIQVRHEKKPLTDKELQEFIISGFPGIGRLNAQNILMHFKTIKNFVNANEEELRKVEKIGELKAKKIKEITEKEYLP